MCVCLCVALVRVSENNNQTSADGTGPGEIQYGFNLHTRCERVRGAYVVAHLGLGSVSGNIFMFLASHERANFLWLAGVPCTLERLIFR